MISFSRAASGGSSFKKETVRVNKRRKGGSPFNVDLRPYGLERTIRMKWNWLLRREESSAKAR